MQKNKELVKMKRIMQKVLRSYGIERAGIFGSYARGEQRKRSDIDIIVDITGLRISLFRFARLKRELEDKLGMKVDLVTYKSLKPRIKQRVLDEEVRVL
jgi:uncharacterized protein